MHGLCNKPDADEFLHKYNLIRMPEYWRYSKNGYCSAERGSLRPAHSIIALWGDKKHSACSWEGRCPSDSCPTSDRLRVDVASTACVVALKGFGSRRRFSLITEDVVARKRVVSASQRARRCRAGEDIASGSASAMRRDSAAPRRHRQSQRLRKTVKICDRSPQSSFRHRGPRYRRTFLANTKATRIWGHSPESWHFPCAVRASQEQMSCTSYFTLAAKHTPDPSITLCSIPPRRHWAVRLD